MEQFGCTLVIAVAQIFMNLHFLSSVCLVAPNVKFPLEKNL